MDMIIKSVKRGRNTQDANRYILFEKTVNSKKKAMQFVGKKIIAKQSKKKEHIGKIIAPHGTKGEMIVRFEHGLPGLMIGKKAQIK